MRKPLRRSLAVLAVAVTAGSLTAVATPASAATTWLQVSAGSTHTCGVTSTHDLWCWGDNYYGQLGTGDTTNRLVPARVGARGIWASVSANGLHTCALDRDGTRYCWGYNGHGRLGYGDTTDRRTPTAADSTWTMISAGENHTCGILTNRRAYCWGLDSKGQLGNNSTPGDNRLSPQRVQFDGRWSAISAGGWSTCGLDSDDIRYCWGENEYDALGLDERATVIPTPTTSGDGTWRSVAMGSHAGCGISSGRRLYCWGNNNYGQLGVGDRRNRSEPTRVDGKNWAQVSRGGFHTCGLKTDGIGYCWGYNNHGQLGINAPFVSHATTPHVIGGLGNVLGRTKEDPMTWSSLSAGGHHTCGIRTDGILFCWGHNTYGQLGDGTTADRPSPREVA